MAAAAAHRPTSSENIIKQGYLKKSVQTSEIIPSASKQLANNIKQKFEPNRWYVFGVRNRQPYLEYFDKEESIFTGQAIHTYDLSTFQSLSYTMGRTNTHFTFCIFLTNDVIDLTAPSRPHMVDWCRCLERHLRNLGLRSKNLKEDHQYTAFPVKKIPRPPAEDPPDSAEQMNFFVLDSDDEDHEYQDATELLRDNNEDGKENGDGTLPLRPPPRIPKRQKDEDIFADLSTVRREEMYSNLEGHTTDVTFAERHLFGEDSDSDSDSDEDDIQGKTKESTGIQNDCYEEEDRCSSLPDIQTHVSETDTSEDSDFVSASFWLRNRRSGLDANESPDVPLRSAGKKPRAHPRNCVSMNVNLLTMDTEHHYDYPPKKSSNHAPAFRKKSDEGTFVIVDQVAKCDNGNTVMLLNDVTDNGDADCENHIKKTGLIGEKDLTLEDGGEYETLTKKPFQECMKRNNDSGKQTEEVYEAAWMCRTARKASLSDDDDVCCKKEFIVDLTKDTKNKLCDHDEVKRDASGKGDDKQKGVFSRLLSKKSRSKELPERLVVELPTDSTHRNLGNCTNGDVDLPGENFYSDLPGAGDELVLDSDIRKLSLLENGPNENNDKPIELPPRYFAGNSAHGSNRNPKFKTVVSVTSGARPKENHLSKSVGDSSQCFGEEAYEPIDVSKNGDAFKNRPPVPIPEKSHSRNLIDYETNSCDEAPVAPPRRKKVEKRNSSPELPQRKQRSPVSPPLPRMRKSMHGSLKSGSLEPAIPPRTHLPNKPALPPPPRPAPISKAASDISGNRPKTIHLTSRQQSTGQSSGVQVMNLKQNQVDILRSEIESTGGLVKLISKVHFQNGLAFVECFGKVWIAGWDVKRYPKLYDKFHIGDELVSINDVQVSDVTFANKLVKNVKAESVEITIRRLPNARVFAIQRSGEGESLGMKRDGGTAEIMYVDPLGLAAKHGLPSKASTLDGNGRCNWCLTEINMRPLNLYFKDNEIEHRLLAVGRDISIVVQPVDFIKELKKQFRKLRGHKDYIIQ